jgi:hypothetical protein
MKPIRISNITPLGVIKGIVLIGLLSTIAWYASYQARFLIAGPQLTLTSPVENTLHDRMVMLEGTAENTTMIRLNGRAINMTEDGRFTEQLVLENGYTIMTLHAVDRYGRDTTLTRHFVYTPSS